MISRKEQAALTRQKIKDAAVQLLQEKDYDQIKIADIANACNMSLGNFYHYFKSLDDLFSEIDSTQFYDMLAAVKPNRGYSVQASLESFFLGWIRMMLSFHGSSYTAHWLRHYTRKAMPAEDSRHDLIASHIAQILEDGVSNGELCSDTPVSSIAYSIAFSILGCTAHFSVTSDAEFVRHWADDYCRIFINSALAPYLQKS